MRNKTLMTVGMLAFAVVALGQSQAPKAERITDERTGTPVVFVTEEDMFPSSWVGGDVRARAESADDDQAQRSARIVTEALAVYPKHVITDNLKRVYVMKSIEFYGLQYGGTNSLDRVYLTARTPEEGYSDAFIFGCFHHEFSSVLLRKYASYFDEKGWNRANPADFTYGSGGTDALRTGEASTRYDAALAESGLLTQYSKASVEEDFNMMAEGLFSGDVEFWRLVDKFPRANKKMKIAVAFYSKLDAQFNEAFFRSRKTMGD